MDNRETIMRVSLAAFASRGFENIGVQEICENSGITKPTLYHYFGSKNGLLKEIMAVCSAKLIKVATESTRYNGDLPLTVNRTVRAYFKFATENRDFYRIFLNLYFAPPESDFTKLSAEYMKRQYTIMESLFLKASHDHGNMKNRQVRLAVTFLGFINSYISLWVNDYCELDEELVFSASHQFMHGIYS
jgi:TetR/AcrR family transcriptional regulator